MRLVTYSVALTLLCYSMLVLGSDVMDLDSSNFDQHVTGAKAAFVEFFAPWCGHCKSLAPVYEEVGTAFAGSNEVLIAKVDADADKSLGGRFNVKGFPTLKFFPKGSTEPEDYSGGRTADDIINFIKEKTGVRAKISKPQSSVEDLTPKNFDTIVKNKEKDVLVEFYAPWCGHCKNLAPIYEKLGTAFKNEDSVVIARVDADAHKDLGSQYGVSGFPTLKYFPKHDKEGVDYSSGRDLDSFVSFINEQSGTFRTSDGRLTELAGVITELDDEVDSFMEAEEADKPGVLDKTKEEIASIEGDSDTSYYIKVMEKIIEKDENFVETEISRLENLLSGGQISESKIDSFSVRINILKRFKEE